MRPESSKAQRDFCVAFLNPLMGRPDNFGNYIKIVGDKPNIAFMAHHDTVHNFSGHQTLEIDEGLNYVFSKDSNCLGADCTTGVWLILEMIKAKVPGVYVVHAGEEIGGIGSSALVATKPEWLDNLDAAISFDRKGYSSIITHQMGGRCCSDSFVKDLNEVLGGGFKADGSGTYTDSAEYTGHVSECTNLSVGYFKQHTKDEYQDLEFAITLLDKLVNADWSKIRGYRDPAYDYYMDQVNSYRKIFIEEEEDPSIYGSNMTTIIENYPEEVAEILFQVGIDELELERLILENYKG